MESTHATSLLTDAMASQTASRKTLLKNGVFIKMALVLKTRYPTPSSTVNWAYFRIAGFSLASGTGRSLAPGTGDSLASAIGVRPTGVLDLALPGPLRRVGRGTAQLC